MSTKPILGRDVYLALAAVGWADGQLTEEAADAIVRCALEEGLDLETIHEIETATKEKTELGSIDWADMTKADRLYVYSVASWITALDGDVTDQEAEALGRLGGELGIPEAPRAHADAIMKEIAAAADRPDRFDLMKLRATVADRLEQAREKRLAQQDGESEPA